MAFELLESQEGAARMARAMQLPPNRRLEDILGPALFRRTAEAAAPLGLATETLQRLKPWALGLAFTLPPPERVPPAPGDPAYDAWLHAERRRRCNIGSACCTDSVWPSVSTSLAPQQY